MNRYCGTQALTELISLIRTELAQKADAATSVTTSAFTTALNKKLNTSALSSSVTSTSTSQAATSRAVKTAYDRIGQVLHRTTYTSGQVVFPSACYQKLTDYAELELETGDQIISFHVQGWKNGSGALSLAQSSDGNSIYAFCSQASTFTSISIEVWYVSGLSI